MFRQMVKKDSQSPIVESRDIKKNFCRGSITLEATIFLVLFILFYMALMDLVQLARAQVILQYSINEAAKEISQYSYVLTKAGIVEKRLKTVSNAADTEKLISSVKDLAGTLSGGVSTENLGEVVGKAEDVYHQGSEYFSGADASKILDKLTSVIKKGYTDAASDFVIAEVAKSVVKEQIENMSTKDADTYLEDLGIKDGFAGLDFSKSNWCGTKSGNMPDLEVTVTYEMDFKLGYLELKPRRFKLVAKTALW